MDSGQWLYNFSFTSLGWLWTFNEPNDKLIVKLCLYPLPIMSRSQLFLLLVLRFSSANKLSLLLLSVLASSLATKASKATPLSGVFFLKQPNLMYSCCHLQMTLRHTNWINSTIPLMVQWKNCYSVYWKVLYAKQTQLKHSMLVLAYQCLSEVSENCIIIFPVFILMCLYCGNWCGQLLTPNDIQHETKICLW